MSTPYPPPAAAPGSDKTALWGALGIVLVFCCAPVGLVFSALSLSEAKKAGRQPTLAYIGFALGALFLVLNILAVATGVLANLVSFGP